MIINLNALVGSDKSATFKLAVIYLGVLHFIQLLNIRADIFFLRPFPVVELLSVVLFFHLIKRRFFDFFYTAEKSYLFQAVTILAVHNLITVFGYFQLNNTYSLLNYIYGIHNCVLPILLFYFVQLIPVEEVIPFFKRILFLNFILCITGILLFLLRPDFYTDYLSRILNDLNLSEAWQLYGRLQSYVGSTSVGNIGTVSFILTIFIIRKGYLRYLYLLTFALTVSFTQQRGPIVFLLFSSLTLTLYYLIAASPVKKIRFISAAFASVIFLIIIFKDVFNENFFNVVEIFSYTIDRVSTETQPEHVLGEREIGYIKAWDIVKQFPLGVGLGATLSASEQASNSGLGQVVDANFARILADTGFIGLGLFFLVLATAFLKSLTAKNLLFFSFIILFYSFQAVGTNVFDSFICIHLFWIYLGVLNKKENNIIWKQLF
jgi:hypothetical protein